MRGCGEVRSPSRGRGGRPGPRRCGRGAGPCARVRGGKLVPQPRSRRPWPSTPSAGVRVAAAVKQTRRGSRPEEARMARLTDEQRRFLRENPFAAVVTTLREDGSPHSTVVWADEDGGDVVFNTALGRAKPRHLERDPRVSVLMVDPGDQYKWVSVSGRAALT